jgi:hypothetical protein
MRSRLTRIDRSHVVASPHQLGVHQLRGPRLATAP